MAAGLCVRMGGGAQEDGQGWSLRDRGIGASQENHLTGTTIARGLENITRPFICFLHTRFAGKVQTLKHYHAKLWEREPPIIPTLLLVQLQV